MSTATPVTTQACQTPADFIYVFGPDARGATPEACAKSTSRKWVRDQDHLAVFTEGATGLVMSSQDALRIFGLKKLEEAIEYGCAIIVRNHAEPANSLRQRRYECDLDQHQVAQKTGMSIEQVRDCENSRTRSDIHLIARICHALGLDPLSVGFVPSRSNDLPSPKKGVSP
ncbi:MAG: hypothetical protein UU08_C0004G0020 [Candidatus Uhrbacteria bacterium GW2011_GWE2_40_58]|nr:MAG: hypothetical protein UT94_C0009G0020 [Candidatus Uhrbacteria bacterium GW2011_GWF2_40_263]KKR68033.1 MAG: hypothetical protein UU08_C0004G0020 [Candidatus Uhrbacteria bacterium GW2011_GWE2_40_58]OGL92932.1 MAG: hypothetical protein A2239_04240 [Candidatus Uhrbacteria bacterium RIFOXYA2_FULL_40_9]OGL97070.1 MAG: hypothetical protein A2332_04245 [Candidatus Uhrbacteria bacterium RIFOXYB2_FULL_41_18]HBK34622.1 hypothetical protein [Candidatus Uhrbacteria bacterium]